MAKPSFAEEVATKNEMGPGEELRGKGKRGGKRRGRRKSSRK